jgi:hypothetical protein
MKFYHDLLLAGMPVAIILVFVCSKLFKKLAVENVIEWIRIILILGGILSIISFFYYLIVDNESTSITRLHGPYVFTYLFMLLSGTLLPFILLREKTGKTIWVLFVVGVLVNSGRIMETIIIMITSFHRDYVHDLPTGGIETAFNGLILGAVMIALEFMIQNHRLKLTVHESETRLNYKLFFIIASSLMIYCISEWLMSIYGLDPPYVFYGMIMQRIVLTFLALLVICFFTSTIKKTSLLN